MEPPAGGRGDAGRAERGATAGVQPAGAGAGAEVEADARRGEVVVVNEGDEAGGDEKGDDAAKAKAKATSEDRGG